MFKMVQLDENPAAASLSEKQAFHKTKNEEKSNDRPSSLVSTMPV